MLARDGGKGNMGQDIGEGQNVYGGLLIAPIEVAQVVALCIQNDFDKPLLTRKEMRQRIIEQHSDAVYTGVMPCGERYIFPLAGLPLEDIPCPCGNTTHWLLKYSGVSD